MSARTRRYAAVFSLLLFACAGLTCVSSHAVMVDKVIVEVNGEVITQREFDRTFDPIKAQIEANFQGEELQNRLEMARKGVLEQLINSKLAISAAKKADIEIDEQELQQRIERIQSYYGSREEFLKALDQKGTNLSEFEKEIREQMLAQQVVQKEISGKITVAPGEVSELYEKNREKLISPKSYKVRTLMVRKSGEDNKAEDRAKAESIRKEIKEGADFSEVAASRSEGPFADKKGDMGYIVQGQLAPPLEEVVLGLKENEISRVVETPIGFHIFKVEDIEEPRQLSLEEVNEFLKDQLYKRKFQEELVEWLEKEREEAHISYK
ncbi:MAG: hypothetical protein GF408_08485 [Candidatus Omnitrophica bacterium]|nr:hypothetical protein [Candidatus Omnitrophota bacterium]